MAMVRALRLFLLLVVLAFLARAEQVAAANDRLSFGTARAEPGMIARLPVYIHDVPGTALNAGTSSDIEEFAFTATFTNFQYIEGCKSTPFPNCQMTFTPAGVLGSLTPEVETISGSSSSISARYAYSTPIPFTLSDTAANLIGFIEMALTADAPPQTVIAFTISAAADATYLRQRAPSTIIESVGAGLEVSGGQIEVSEECQAPPATLGITWTGSGCSAPSTSCVSGQSVLFGPANYTYQDCDTASWKFGDGTTSTERFPSHKFPAGTFAVELTVANRKGAQTKSVTLQFEVANPGPTCSRPTPAGITVSGAGCSSTSCPQGVELTFGPAGYTYQKDCDSASWSFGDGTTSTVLNPKKTFPRLGSFTVRLTVANSAGTSVPVTREIIISGGAPSCSSVPRIDQISINWSGATCTADGCGAADPITFSARFSGYELQECDRLTWSFGDGTTATAVSPTHSFASNGTYLVAMTLSNTTGSVTVEKPLRIGNGVPGIPPCACTASAPPTAHTGYPVPFTGKTGTCEGARPSWRFGDNSAVDSTGNLSPLHLYTRAGTYTWQFVVAAPNRPDCVFSGTITIMEPGPKRRAVRGGP